MGELINYLEYKEKLQKELEEFLACIEESTKAFNTTLEDELANRLDPVEREYYDHLLNMLAILERWEVIDQARQKTKRTQACKDRAIEQ